MDGFAILIAIVTFILALVALHKISSLETKLAQLKLQLGNTIGELEKLREAPAIANIEAAAGAVTAVSELPRGSIENPVEAEAAAAAAVFTSTEMAAEDVTNTGHTASAEAPVAALGATQPDSSNWVGQNQDAPPAESAPVPRHRARDRDMEQALASRWFVWIGGLAIAIGGLLFVKYAYDNNLIPPTLQIFLGLVAGAALAAAGELVRRKSAPGLEHNSVPAALTAGGIVTLFGSIYAAYALYELIAPAVAFVGLAVVAVGALGLARVQGPLIAALGLIGSYGTPAIIPSESPSAWGLFPYLTVILAASFATLRGRGWWWLGYSAIAASALWTLLWMGGPFTPADTLPVGVFAHVIGLVACFGLLGFGILAPESGSLRGTAPMTQPLTVGLAGIAAETVLLAMLVHKSGHSTLSLALFLTALAVQVSLAWRKPGLDLLAPVAAALSLVVLMTWREAAFHDFAMDENGLWSSIPGAAAREFLWWMLGTGLSLVILGALGARLKPAPVLWASMAGAAAALFVTGAWARVDVLLSPTLWALIAIAIALGLLATAYSGRRRHDTEREINLASGLLSIGAAVLMLFSADRWFDGVGLTLIIAALALLFAILAGLMRVTLNGSIAAAYGGLATLRLFMSRHLLLDDRGLPLGQHWLLYGYGVPAVLFLAASRALKSAGYMRAAVSLEGLSLGLAISLASLEIRVLIGGGVTAGQPQLLEIAAHVLTWLGAAYGLLYRQRLYSSVVASWGARLLLAGSVATIAVGSLLALNPVFSGDAVQGGVFFNALLLAYPAPAVLLWLIARALPSIGLGNLRAHVETLAVALVTAYLSLQLMRFYGGVYLGPEPRDELEAALHVIMWLGLAAVLLYTRGVLHQQAVEWSGRALLALAVTALVFGALILYNPVLTGQPLRGNAIFNSLLLSCLVPVGLIAVIAMRLEVLGWKVLRPAAGGVMLLLVFAYVTLETKRLLQGPVMVPQSLSLGESYAYSAVWLALALGLFVAGLRFSKRYVRYAGLGVMVLVVLKVFLWDMSNLEGLLRIASFIGLGLCLVGIGWLYQRFVQPSGAIALDRT